MLIRWTTIAVIFVTTHCDKSFEQERINMKRKRFEPVRSNKWDNSRRVKRWSVSPSLPDGDRTDGIPTTRPLYRNEANTTSDSDQQASINDDINNTKLLAVIYEDTIHNNYTDDMHDNMTTSILVTYNETTNISDMSMPWNTSIQPAPIKEPTQLTPSPAPLPPLYTDTNTTMATSQDKEDQVDNVFKRTAARSKRKKKRKALSIVTVLFGMFGGLIVFTLIGVLAAFYFIKRKRLDDEGDYIDPANEWAPERIRADQFAYRGPLQIPFQQSMHMSHELENERVASQHEQDHVAFDDNLNAVYEIGSEVERVVAGQNKNVKIVSESEKAQAAKEETERLRQQQVNPPTNAAQHPNTDTTKTDETENRKLESSTTSKTATSNSKPVNNEDCKLEDTQRSFKSNKDAKTKNEPRKITGWDKTTGMMRKQ